MPKLSSIATILNTALKADVFSTFRFQSAKYYDIVSLIKEVINDVQTTKPCTIDNDGECTPVIVDDNYPMQIYHRIMSLNYEQVAEDNYGDPVNFIKENASMSLVLIADRGRLQMEAEDLLSLIAVNLKPTLTTVQLAALSLISCNIYANGEAVIDSEIVYNREYNTQEFLLKPNLDMYSLSYTIEMVYGKNCLSACE